MYKCRIGRAGNIAHGGSYKYDGGDLKLTFLVSRWCDGLGDARIDSFVNNISIIVRLKAIIEDKIKEKYWP